MFNFKLLKRVCSERSIAKLTRQTCRFYMQVQCKRTMSTVRVEAEPQRALVDEPVVVRVQGLSAGQRVTLGALLQEGKLTYTSYAHYQADQAGCLDLSKDPSSGGSYQGVEPAGLLWSVTPAPDMRRGVRVMKNDITQPFHVRVSVLEGHIQADTTENHAPDCVLAHVLLERTYMAPWVCREQVREGALRATLFYPTTGGSRHPGVVDLYGTAGGLVEYRAALLASRGFTTLALAYFGYEDISPDPEAFSLEYFEEAVDWLHDHPRVSPGGVGMIAISKGTELAMLTAINTTKVKAVVSISAAHINCIWPNTYKGQDIPAVLIDPSQMEIVNGATKYSAWLNADNVDQCILPIQNAPHAQFLFIHGTDDMMYVPSHPLALVQRLREAGHHNFELHIYPKAGHLLEPPYTPFCREPWHKVYKMYVLYGGYLKPHAKAQEDMWPRILFFLRRNLPPINTENQQGKGAMKSHL